MLGGLSCNCEDNACGEMLSVGCNGYLECSVRWGFRAFLAKDCLPRMGGVLPDSRRTLKDLSGMSEERWIL